MASNDDIGASVAAVSTSMKNAFLQKQYGKLGRKKAQVGNRQVPTLTEGNTLRDQTPEERKHDRSQRGGTLLDKYSSLSGTVRGTVSAPAGSDIAKFFK